MAGGEGTVDNLLLSDKIQIERKQFFFDLKDRSRIASSTMKSVVRLKTPPYVPYIKIWIPKAEAKIIYRAIPREGLIVLTQ